MTNADVIAKSQAKGDYTKDAGGFFMLPLLGVYGQRNFLLPHPLDLPPFWSPLLDGVYLMTLSAEKMWAEAIGIAASKVASMDWTIDGPTTTVARETNQLMAFGARGMARTVTDYLLSCNGAWVEIVHETRAAGSRVIGMVPLDSRRVMRTGDPDRPALYTLLNGTQVEYRAHQIAEITDLPDPSGGWLGVGHCAADRAYTTIRRMHMADLITDDKLSDRRPNKLVAIKGVNRKDLENAFTEGEAKTSGRGLVLYQGTYFLVGIGDDKPETVEIDLKGLPENFDLAAERVNARLSYANAIGLDPLDLQEPRGGLGTGQQAEILAEKAKGRGLALFIKQWQQLMNMMVVSRRSTFTFTERDLRDELKREQVNKAKSDRVKVDIESQVLTPDQGLQHLVDEGVYKQEFLPEDVTDDSTISGEENPDAIEAEQDDREDAEVANTPSDDGEDLPEEVIVTKAADGQPYSVMIAFRPSFEIRRLLAVPGGVSEDDIHLTLALFDVQSVSEFGSIYDAVNGFASGRPAMRAEITGTATFQDHGDGVPSVVLVSAPELPDFRQSLVEAVRSIGLIERRNFGYIPHITRGYNIGQAPDVGALGLMLDEMVIVVDYGDPLPVRLKDPALVVKEDRRWAILEQALQAVAAHA